MAVDFLHLPTEIRLQIYDFFLAQHQHVRRKSQPTNAHLRLLHTCRMISNEAGPKLRGYVSLWHEHQIYAFLNAVSMVCARIEWADVANDGRIFQSADSKDQEDTPLSNLHLALTRMTVLRRLRVFECRQGLPINLQTTMKLHRSQRLELNFERAMFPSKATDHSAPPRLTSYELYINPDRHVDVFESLRPTDLVSLRFSGEILTRIASDDRDGAESMRMPALRHVTLHGIAGHHFDRLSLDECFPAARLESFTYALGHRLGFELRNHHLESLASVYGATLRRLVLLGCSRLSSTVITQCLRGLPALEYFALHIVTVDELRSNFVIALPELLTVFKLQVINAWYAVALKKEERGLCDAFENSVLLRDKRFHHVAVCFRDQLMTEGGRQQRWAEIATRHRFKLQMGPWESHMIENM